jgi:hypothetical protein
MMIENIEENELTASERGVLATDRERWKQSLSAGTHLDEWLAFGNGLMIRRRMAMRVAYVNRPQGRGYVEAFNRIMVKDGFYQDKPEDPEQEARTRTAFTAVLWLHDQLDRLQILRELRGAMSPGERARLNSPISARQYVEREFARREAEARKQSGDAETEASVTPAAKESKLAKLERRNAELERQLAEANAKLARTDAGSLFDLSEPVAVIAPVFEDEWSPKKLRELSKASAEAARRKEQRLRQKPAG